MKRVVTLSFLFTIAFALNGQINTDVVENQEALFQLNPTEVNSQKHIEITEFNKANKKRLLKTQTASIQLDSIIEYEENQSSSGVVEYSKEYFKYNANGDLTLEEQYYWEDYWEYNDKDVYLYNAKGLLSEEIDYRGDSLTFTLDDKREYFYDANDMLIEIYYYYHDSTAFVLESKEEFTYDFNGNIVMDIEYDWDGSVWEKYYKYDYTYNSNNDRTQYVSSRWDGSAWEYRYKSDYMFDSNFHLIQRISYDWISGAWENQNWYQYFPDVNGNDTLTTRKAWENGAWENKYRARDTYDANNNQTLRIDEYWNSGYWEKYYKRERTYDSNNNETLYMFYMWSSNYWRNSSKYTYLYDSNNNEIEELRYSWSNNMWVESDKYTHDYDLSYGVSDMWVPDMGEFENKILVENSYDYDNSAWVLEDTIAYYFSSIPIGIPEYNELAVNIFPNPTTGLVNINYEANESLKIMVIDITGRTIIEKTSNKNNARIDLSSMPVGIYFIRVSDGKATTTRKVVKY